MGMPVTDMGEMVGFIGFFIDSEGQPHRRAQAAEAGLSDGRLRAAGPRRGGGGRSVRPPPRSL